MVVNIRNTYGLMPDATGISIGIVVGMTAEARLVRGATRYRVAIGGGTPDGASMAARGLISAGATALISVGLAGGLDPGWAPGRMVVPARILCGGVWFDADPGLVAWLGGATAGALIATTAAVGVAADKLALFRGTGAVAVDLESGAVAEAARAHGLAFAALRVICDPAGRGLPPAALAALDPRGGIAALRVAGSILRHPGQIPALLRLAGDARAANAALRAALAALPAFPG